MRHLAPTVRNRGSMRLPKSIRSLTLASLTLALGGSFTGCELSDNAKKSAENSKQAADNSTNLLDLNNNAYGDGRQGGARDRREKAIDTMLKAVSLEGKLAAAASYMSALEYQLFKDNGFREDDDSKRVRLITEGVSEFMKIQKDFLKPNLEPKISQDSVGNQTSELPLLSEALKDESIRNAFALAGAMQKISERQLEASKRYGFNAISMIDFFAEAMAASERSVADPRVLSKQPAYVYEILRESGDAVALLEMRVNLFAGTALRAIGSPIDASSGRLVIKANAVQLRDASDRLKLAVQSAGILASARLTPRIFGDVRAGLGRLVDGLNSIPAGGLESIKSPNLAKLLEVKALAEKISPKE